MRLIEQKFLHEKEERAKEGMQRVKTKASETMKAVWKTRRPEMVKKLTMGSQRYWSSPAGQERREKLKAFWKSVREAS